MEEVSEQLLQSPRLFKRTLFEKSIVPIDTKQGIRMWREGGICKKVENGRFADSVYGHTCGVIVFNNFDHLHLSNEIM